MEKSLLTEVKAILKSLVISCPDKITIEKLNRDYRDVEGQFIPFRQLGYSSIEQFLGCIPDTLRVFGSGPTAMVCFVANEKSDHIHNMIMKQKKPRPKARTRPRSRNRFNSFQRGNMVNANTQNSTKIAGQQLSPYQNVKRDHMTKIVQVRNLPSVVRGYESRFPLDDIYGLPQPNGILLNPPQCINYSYNPVLSSTKAINQNHNYEKEVSSLLERQCSVSNPPPLIPRQIHRIETISPKAKPSEENEVTQKEYLIEKTAEFKKYEDEESLNKRAILFNEIKAPKAKKQTTFKLSDEEQNLLTIPKLSKITKTIEAPSTENNSGQLCNEENPQNEISVNTRKSRRSNSFFDDSSDRVEDPEEAVPSYAAKNNVFRLDFPEHTVPYGSKIAAYKISDDITVGSCIKVFISEIHSPFKFWIHIHEDDHELDLLMHQIERYYSNLDYEDFCIPMMCLSPGQVCAALYNGLWHRAEIVSPPVNTHIKVSFIDYGTVTEVEIKNVKFLASYFAKLPAQAIRASLSHIKPRSLHWSYEATTCFLTLVEELLLYAKITEIDREKNILSMILCDTNGEENVQINKFLVDNHHALYDEEWKVEKIKQNNGKRVHHPREDFPTFSMIESGEYPSFPELVALQERGINYEDIYDVILYNQSTILNKHEFASERLRNLPYFLTTSNPFRSEILLELYATSSKAI